LHAEWQTDTLVLLPQLLLMVLLLWQPSFRCVQCTSLRGVWPHHQQPVVQALVHLLQAGQGWMRHSGPQAAKPRRGTHSVSAASQGVKLLPSAAASVNEPLPAHWVCMQCCSMV
jgi:hypothetical protein